MRDSAALASRVRVVTSGETIPPLSEEERGRRNYIDKNGKPKQPKVDLSPGDTVIVVQWELYASKHRCDLCGSERKSQRVVLLRSQRTGESFHAARNCLEYYFGVSIDEFDKQSRLLVRLVNGLLKRLGIRSSDDLDTMKALTLINDRFLELQAFSCDATAEAQTVLHKVRSHPQLAASGRLDTELRQVIAYVLLQEEYRLNPDGFVDRWEALRTHPASWVKDSKTTWPTQLLKRVVGDSHSLSLIDMEALTTLLETAGKYEVLLRNPAILPWRYPTRDDYVAALQEHYQFEASRAPKSTRFHARSPEEALGNRLLREAERKRPYIFNLWAPQFVTSWFGSRVLPNQDSLEAQGARITFAPTYRSEDVGGENRKNVCNLLGVAVYYPDRWGDTYAIWHKYGGEKGRRLLERLDHALFQPEQRATHEKRATKSQPVTGSRRVKRGANILELAVTSNQGSAKARSETVLADQRAVADFVASGYERASVQLDRLLTETEKEKLRPLLAAEFLARDGSDQAFARKIEVQLLSLLTAFRESPAELMSMIEPDVDEAPTKRRRIPAPDSSPGMTGATKLLPRHAPKQEKQEEEGSQQQWVFILEGQRTWVQERVAAAKDLGLNPRWIAFAKTDPNSAWKAKVTLRQADSNLMAVLLEQGWRG